MHISQRSDLLTSFWKHHPIADQSGESLARETIAFYEKFKFDFVKLTPAGCWQAACYGVHHAWEPNPVGIRTITKTIINQPTDWLNLPDFSTAPLPALMKEMTDACNRVNAHFVSKVPVFFTLFCPISQAVQMAGRDVFLNHVKASPNEVLAGLQRITKNTLLTIQAFREAGAQGLYFVTQHMREEMLPEYVYKQFGSTFDAECLNSCADFPLNFFHIHGAGVYFCFEQLPDNCTVHFEAAPSNGKINSDRHTHKTPLSIGIPPELLLKTTSEDDMVRLLSEYILPDQTANILTAGCVLPLDFPDEVVLKWLGVIKNYNDTLH